jgi:uncharacterized protein (DUF1778 family)
MAHTEKRNKRKTAPKQKTLKRVRTELRFLNADHYDLVARAAKLKGLSMNSWLVETTLAQARNDLHLKLPLI